MGKLKVVELFAGVGGFRLGLEGYEKKSPSSGYEKKWPQILRLFGVINMSL